MNLALRISTVVMMSLFMMGSAVAAPVQGEPPYEQPIWFQWERAELDILIVPPNHGQIYNEGGPLGGQGPGELTPTNSYLKAIDASIEAYRQAAAEFGPRWLKKGLELRSYVLGRDQVPQEALEEPEIVVVTDESKASVLGIAINLRPCIVNNSKMMTTSVTYADMYNIMGQEFGHCLGLDHVAGGRPGDPVLALDVLNGTYPHQPGQAENPLHCLSNMNVAGLKVVFGPALGKRIPLSTVETPPAAYRTTDCLPNP
jgi:hypothetical protein